MDFFVANIKDMEKPYELGNIFFVNFTLVLFFPHKGIYKIVASLSQKIWDIFWPFLDQNYSCK